MGEIIKAVAGVLYQDNKVLMASRPAGKPYEGYWEFPGGKVELNESINEALIRELKEEISITTALEDLTYLTCIKQEFANDKTLKYTVHLDVIMVSNWTAEVNALEGQTLYWHNLKDQCDKEPLLATTTKILNLLKNYSKGNKK